MYKITLGGDRYGHRIFYMEQPPTKKELVYFLLSVLTYARHILKDLRRLNLTEKIEAVGKFKVMEEGKFKMLGEGSFPDKPIKRGDFFFGDTHLGYYVVTEITPARPRVEEFLTHKDSLVRKIARQGNVE